MHGTIIAWDPRSQTGTIEAGRKFYRFRADHLTVDLPRGTEFTVERPAGLFRPGLAGDVRPAEPVLPLDTPAMLITGLASPGEAQILESNHDLAFAAQGGCPEEAVALLAEGAAREHANAVLGVRVSAHRGLWRGCAYVAEGTPAIINGTGHAMEPGRHLGELRPRSRSNYPFAATRRYTIVLLVSALLVLLPCVTALYGRGFIPDPYLAGALGLLLVLLALFFGLFNLLRVDPRFFIIRVRGPVWTSV